MFRARARRSPIFSRVFLRARRARWLGATCKFIGGSPTSPSDFAAATGNNLYNALNLRVEKRHASGLNFLMNYTWSKNLESNGNGSSSWNENGRTRFPLDCYNLHKERSHMPLVFIVSYGYELPFGPGRPWLSNRGPAGHVLGGWQINGIFTARFSSSESTGRQIQFGLKVRF